MAATYTAQRAAGYSSLNIKKFSVLLDNSYPSGGYLPTLANLGLTQTIDTVIFGMAVATAFALLVQWDDATGKIRVFYPTGGATTAPSTVAAPLSTTGGSTASAVNATTPAITPGAAKEVPTGADLSAYTVFGVAIGI